MRNRNYQVTGPNGLILALAVWANQQRGVTIFLPNGNTTITRSAAAKSLRLTRLHIRHNTPWHIHQAQPLT